MLVASTKIKIISKKTDCNIVSKHHQTYFNSISLTDNGHETKQRLPKWKQYERKKNMKTSLIVVTTVLGITCLAYILLSLYEKYLIRSRREERIYVNQSITAWFRHSSDKWNHNILYTKYSVSKQLCIINLNWNDKTLLKCAWYCLTMILFLLYIM